MPKPLWLWPLILVLLDMGAQDEGDVGTVHSKLS
jgi:hypothetical protein